MWIWFAIPLGVGVIAVLGAVVRRSKSSVTALHLDR
jgi:hypothetical protein